MALRTVQLLAMALLLGLASGKLYHPALPPLGNMTLSYDHVWDDRYLEPSFFIVGEQKCGTTTLYGMLSSHPDIRVPEIKEICYFGTMKRAGISTIHDYMDMYPRTEEHRSNVITGEGCTHYLSSAVAARELKKYFPNAKIIVSVRDPVARFVSAYKHSMREAWGEKARDEYGRLSINAEVDQGLQREMYNNLLQRGLYHKHILEYASLFDPKNIAVVSFNDLKRDPVNIAGMVQEFIGIHRDNWNINSDLTHLNAAPGTTVDKSHPHDDIVIELDEKHRRLLCEYYKPYSLALFRILQSPPLWDVSC